MTTAFLPLHVTSSKVVYDTDDEIWDIRFYLVGRD